MHWGVLGMKWGIRRYQNPDGTLTEAGKKRYGENAEHTYTSFGTRRRNWSAQRATKKGSPKAEKKAMRAAKSQELDDRMQAYAKRVGVGGNIVTRLLTSDRVGGKSYQTMLAALNGQNDHGFTQKKVHAFLASFGWNIAATLAFPFAGTGNAIIRRRYVKGKYSGYDDK